MKISLKFKLLTMLVGLSLAILLVYATIAQNDFREDKIAYVFEATLSKAQGTSTQLKSELDFNLDKIEFLLRGYNEHGFHSYSKGIFASEKNIDFVGVYKIDMRTNKYVTHNTLKNARTDGAFEKTYDEVIQTLCLEAEQNQISLRTIKASDSLWLFALRSVVNGQNAIIISLINNGHFLQDIQNPTLQDMYIVNQQAQILAGPQNKMYPEISDQTVEKAIEFSLSKLNSPQSVNEYKMSSDTLLLSTVKVGLGDLRIISVVPKSTALEALKALMIKSIVFLLFLIFLTIVIAILAANKLTASLKLLHQATTQVSQGDFNVNLKLNSNDEIGELSKSFNIMAGEINRLIIETAEKSRMEAELQTAQLVQSTLFPEPSFDFGPFSIRGYYQSASETGGDWYYYNQIQNKTYLWIGDATGHGVPAALVTSAARSAAKVLEQLPDLSSAQLMEILNKSIYESSKGKVLMTFFIGIFNNDTDELEYTNASHDPPLLIPYKDKVKRNHVIPLIDNQGPRLGEAIDSTYESTTITISKGERLVFYTDGVTELKNDQGEMWGEREFVNAIIKRNKDENLDDTMNALDEHIQQYRNGAPLEDDVTYFMFRNNP
ncbi:MAG: SpoIIE family protein phosphatase [Bdellovibrionales bacterium]|nr:SpoIIE family protein phosphatase [Bdellovibrionales bacterium]